MKLNKYLSIAAGCALACVVTQQVWARPLPGTKAVEFDPAEPAQWECGATNMNQFALFPVPSGKRLVIESVWFEGATDTESLSAIVGFNVRTTVNGTTVEHRFNPGAELGPGGGYGRTYRVDKQLRLYADPGTELGLIGLNSNSSGEYNCGWSGYFMDGS